MSGSASRQIVKNSSYHLQAVAWSPHLFDRFPSDISNLERIRVVIWRLSDIW
jgi:hypothetical protein